MPNGRDKHAWPVLAGSLIHVVLVLNCKAQIGAHPLTSLY